MTPKTADDAETTGKNGFVSLKKKKDVTVVSASSAVFGVFFFTLLFAVPQLNAQDLEGRIDAIVAGPPAIHAGAGITVPAGTYVRTGLEGGIGASKDGVSGRLDALTRFHLDPFREHRWAPYGGGGVTARFDVDRKTRFYLLIVAGVDGPDSHGVATSIEAGLGGGGRIGLVIRRAAAQRG
jgi:hypothetical protein